MRVLDAGLAAHLAGGQTTLCACWRVTRGDGVVLGFTDHDRALSFEGTTFAPSHGLDGGEQPHKLGGQVETAEVLGVLDDDAIQEEDIVQGRYDGALVECFRVNWQDVGQRLLLRRLTIGEIVREDGVFRAELRSAQHALNVPSGRIYQGLCDAELGDGRCGVNLAVPAYRAIGAVTGIADRYRLAVSGLAGFAEGHFSFGTAEWTAGRRAGRKDRVLGHRRLASQDVLAFAEPVGDFVLPGDAVTVSAGCDRQFATCRNRFGNGVNFRGFPHIPGADFILRYPREGERLDGRPLVG